MGRRIARSSAFLAGLGGVVIGAFLLLRPDYNLCPPHIAYLCDARGFLWQAAALQDFPITYAPILLWSLPPLLASITIFGVRTSQVWSALATAIAAAVEVTSLANLDALDVTLSSGRVFVIDFGHYYAMYVLPFAILAVAGSLVSWAELSRDRR